MTPIRVALGRPISSQRISESSIKEVIATKNMTSVPAIARIAATTRAITSPFLTFSLAFSILSVYFGNLGPETS